MRNLTTTDDMRIRKEAFSEAEKLLRKMDRMEANLADFQSKDQRLFGEWERHRFQEARHEIARLQEEYRDLCRFHNWMIALSEMEGLSLPEALVALRREQREYEIGDQDTRARIDLRRRRRDDYITDDIRGTNEGERDYGRHSGFDFDDEADEDPFGDTEVERLDFVASLNGPRLRELCRNRDFATMILAAALSAAQSEEELKVFLRVWNHTPGEYQDEFASGIEEETGQSLESIVLSLRREFEFRSRAEEAESRTGHDQTRQSLPHPSLKAKSDPQESESFKLLYRKLARKLHPDLIGGAGAMPVWQKNLWYRVQAAHQKRDRRELERLFKFVLVRTRDLQSLDLSEIRQSRSWLAEEVDRLEGQIKGVKSSLAWRFSKRRSRTTLERKIEKIIARERDGMLRQIDELKRHHEVLARSALRRKHPGRRR